MSRLFASTRSLGGFVCIGLSCLAGCGNEPAAPTPAPVPEASKMEPGSGKMDGGAGKMEPGGKMDKMEPGSGKMDGGAGKMEPGGK